MNGFEDRINENSTEFEKEFLKNYDGNLWTALEKMKNWQPPKPQQDLPVIPAYVAEQIERIKKSNNSYASLGLFDSNYERKPKYAKWIQNSINEFMVACTVGYTVEKPQLFYLRDELTGQFLAKYNLLKDKDKYFFWTGADPLTHSIGTAWKLTFTQEEIDNMQTGSYEQIEVEE